MDVTPLIPAGRQIIEAYGDRGFRVSGRRYEGSLLVFPSHSLLWDIGDIQQLRLKDLDAFLEAGRERLLDLLLLGCGSGLVPIAVEIRRHLRDHGIVIEPMDTGAACRTYNVLLAEGRKIAAALVAVP